MQWLDESAPKGLLEVGIGLESGSGSVGVALVATRKTRRSSAQGTVETRVSRWPGSSRRSPDQPNQLLPPQLFFSALFALAVFWFVPGWVVQTDRWQGRPA